MSYYPSTQGISRAELEEEFHDESDILGDSLSSHHQYWDRISDYIDPLSSASGLPTDTEAAAAAAATTLSPPVVEATYIAQGVPVQVEDEKEESASRSRSRYSYFSGLPRTSKGGSRVASTSQGGATQSFAPSHYVTGDMPSAAGTRASLWQNRRQLMEEAQASLVQENKRKSPVHLRGYARTGPYGRSFSWPVLCCLIIGGPILVIIGRGDKETPDMSDAPTMRPTESTNIRPPTSQPSLLPTEQPSIAPSLSPILSPTEPPIVVDFTVEPILYMVHANTPVPLSVLVPPPLSSVAIYEGEYLAVGDMCNETNATMWISSFDFNATEQSTNIFVRPTEANTTVQIGFGVDLTQAIDSTMVLCVNASVVAAAYHLFPENITEQDAEVRLRHSSRTLNAGFLSIFSDDLFFVTVRRDG